MQIHKDVNNTVKLKFAEDLATSAGISEEHVVKILDTLGLSEVLDEVRTRLGIDVAQLNKDDLRVSAKIGRLIVAR